MFLSNFEGCDGAGNLDHAIADANDIVKSDLNIHLAHQCAGMNQTEDYNEEEHRCTHKALFSLRMFIALQINDPVIVDLDMNDAE